MFKKYRLMSDEEWAKSNEPFIEHLRKREELKKEFYKKKKRKKWTLTKKVHLEDKEGVIKKLSVLLEELKDTLIEVEKDKKGMLLPYVTVASARKLRKKLYEMVWQSIDAYNIIVRVEDCHGDKIVKILFEDDVAGAMIGENFHCKLCLYKNEEKVSLNDVVFADGEPRTCDNCRRVVYYY